MSYKFLLVILDSINSFIWPAVPFILVWSMKMIVIEKDTQRGKIYVFLGGVCILLLLELVIMNCGTNVVDIWSNN